MPFLFFSLHMSFILININQFRRRCIIALECSWFTCRNLDTLILGCRRQPQPPDNLA